MCIVGDKLGTEFFKVQLNGEDAERLRALHGEWIYEPGEGAHPDHDWFYSLRQNSELNGDYLGESTDMPPGGLKGEVFQDLDYIVAVQAYHE